jgi:hypothetical protein
MEVLRGPTSPARQLQLDRRIEKASQPFYQRCIRGKNRKLLVKNEGELLLVDIHQTIFQFSMKIFKLDEKMNKWVKLMKLEGRVLFVGSGSSFSASGWDMCLPKGNPVIFFIIPSSLLTIWHAGTMFFTWIEVSFRMCLNIPNVTTCSFHRTGSSKSEFIIEYFILYILKAGF